MQNAQLRDESPISLELNLDYNYGNQDVKSIEIKSTKKSTHISSPDALIFANEKGQIRYINLEAQELTGWYITDAMNKNSAEVFRIYDLESKNQLADPVEKILETNSKIDLTTNILLKSKDNLKFEIQYKASPKYKENGELNKIILTFQKIKEIKEDAPVEKNNEVSKSEVQSKPKELSINELSFNDIDNEPITKIEKGNDKTKETSAEEKERSLKVVDDEQNSTEIKTEIEKPKRELNEDSNFSDDESLSIDLELDDDLGKQINSSSIEDNIDYETKTVKKIDSDSPKQKSNVYSISNEDLEDIDSLDFLDDI